MTHIAIIGFGVVGGGITEVIRLNKKAILRATGDEINVKYILDLRDFPDSPYADRVVHDFSVILNDPEVKIVCETMGGVNPAFDYSMQALRAGKSVVTSNKELVANRGVELMAEAKKNGVSYMFEASAGGGIPEIRSLRTSFGGDTVSEIDGILNGTTNYILTKMKNEGADFAEVLKEAQKLGYAEANPAADVDGIDAQRKIVILTAIVTNQLASCDKVYTETMTKITPADMDAAARWGGTVKLLGSSRIDHENGKTAIYVCPTFVPNSCPIAHVDDVYNGIRVNSPVTNDYMLYGRGAGRMPTAGAVVSDVVSILSGVGAKELAMDWEHAEDDFVLPFGDISFAYYVRISTDSVDETLEKARLVFGEIEVLAGSPAGYVEFITAKIAEKDANATFEGGALGEVESRIRLM
ncbi:MAG: homoserine dehydrogenase [Clostridia bacterium]|nr:homoserine dehydrogenase [Clostridia bacterium]